MSSRKRLATVIDQILTSEKDQAENVEASIVDDYKKLNEKCDATMDRFNSRKKKGKKKIQQSEE